MKYLIQSVLILLITIGLVACESKTEKSNTENDPTGSAKLEKPSDADFLAFMVYHHMNYMIKYGMECYLKIGETLENPSGTR